MHTRTRIHTAALPAIALAGGAVGAAAAQASTPTPGHLTLDLQHTALGFFSDSRPITGFPTKPLVPGDRLIGHDRDLHGGLQAGRDTEACTVAAAVVVVSLVYDLMLITVAQSAQLGGQQTATAVAAYGLFAAAEHIFLIVPPLLLPLGLVLLRTPVLPRPFALLAIVLGATGPVLGLVGLFTVTANNNGPAGAAINALLAAQGLWMIAAAITVPLHRPQATR